MRREFGSRMFAVAIGVGALLAMSGTAVADTYKVDGVHSSVVFRVKHMNVSYFYGRFNEVSGRFTFDDSEPANSSFEITVKTKSIDTRSKKREKHLKSPDFFHVKQFPTIEFKSTAVKKTGDDTFEVTGDLTLHGETRPITVTVERVGVGPGRRGGSIAGFETVFNIKRSDFGMNFMVGPLGDDVRLMVGIEGRGK